MSTHSLRTKEGAPIHTRKRYFCDHPTDPSKKEILVVEKLPHPDDQYDQQGLIICRNNRFVCRHVPPSYLRVDLNSVAKELWTDFGNVPVDQNEHLETPFLRFPKGTHREDVWHWFEANFNLSVATDLMGIDNA
jgi:hypothetical protein